MYKIYINQTELILVSTDNLPLIPMNAECSLHKYNGKKVEIGNLIQYWEYNNIDKKIILYFENLDKLIKDFESHFVIVHAGGGFILNENNECVLIHRRGFWDLPKGKLDPGETIEECAIREVKEEVGIKELSIISKLCDSRHIYRKRSGNRAIKLSHWYIMKTNSCPLVPQVEEDIVKAIWCSILDLPKYHKETFPSIQGVIKEYKKTI